MFNGIIESSAEVKKVQKGEGCILFSILVNDKKILRKLKVGASLAVNGACLSVMKKSNSVITFYVMKETLEKTNLGYLKEGDKVNIEMPITPSTFISGHIVAGHIDCIGRITKIIDIVNNQKEMWINVPYKFKPLLVYKGSIAVDGVSLTISGVRGNNFKVSLIPLTLQKTNLGLKKVNDPVNIEFDYIVKIVKNFAIV